ncbi:MAG: SRPBCC family protein [Thermoactinospora sp.]|nr:SRPBCC family protein [Thermoactinospora sp.]
MEATLTTVNGDPVLRLERRLAHPPAKVWRAVTDPAELAHWFPASVEAEQRPGAAMRFTFPGEDEVTHGEVLEVDPPRVYMFRWGHDVLRFELIPDGEGCLLVLTHTLGGGAVGRLGAGRTAAGWDSCLATLLARLDGRDAPQERDPLGPMEHYVEAFGLAEGTVTRTGDGFELAFAHDMVWRSAEQIWAQVVRQAPGEVLESDEPRLLVCAVTHDGRPAGTVRWEIVSDRELGVRVERTHTVPGSLASLVPALLAEGQVGQELLFAAVMGEPGRPWPRERYERLVKQYSS